MRVAQTLLSVLWKPRSLCLMREPPIQECLCHIEASTNLRLRRLPQLEAISLGVRRPSEAAVFAVIDLLVDRRSGFAKLSEHGIEIVDSVIDHEWGDGRIEVLRRRWKWRPNSHTDGVRLL